MVKYYCAAKNNEEHEYVVRSIVQQLHDVTSTLHIPTSPVLLKNKQVQHLYTPIVGRINTNVSIRNIVYKLHPTPALGGVPQQKAMDYIRNHEMMTRGLFASPVGYFTRDNIGEFVVGIRSMYVNGKNARLFAGAGIVVDSDSQQEFYETSLKFQPMHELLEELSTNGCTNV
ncbi:hypothetical protein GCM10025879_04020 [Leuconostoc litchii]|nr:chorismate-binding protein [Leuconostoc litchii]GMA69156.1 hypothetical protein GCM10025879_04020 [Leuconostoc litchii]